MTESAPALSTAGARCFVALSPDSESRLALVRCRESIERSSAGVARGLRFVDPASLHLTLRFLGDSTPAQIAYFTHVLPTLAPRLPALPARRLAVWPNRARPRLLVLELECVPVVLELAAACEAHACKAGFTPEPRPFRAHVTLARLRPGCAFGILPNPPPALAFDAVALMQSALATSAARYSDLARASLASG